MSPARHSRAERRQALAEIDALAAVTLGITAEAEMTIAHPESGRRLVAR